MVHDFQFAANDQIYAYINYTYLLGLVISVCTKMQVDILNHLRVIKPKVNFDHLAPWDHIVQDGNTKISRHLA